jgi:glycosyltransferase involved in cell wall biosynthesis
MSDQIEFPDKKVLVCVPTAEYARRADFYDYFTQLDLDPGWYRVTPHGQSPARNRNIAIELALTNEFTHIMFIDDDVVFKPDLVKRLLRHNLDVIGGLYLMRSYPHAPIAFDYADERGYCRHRVMKESDNGVVQVESTGLGCVLVNMEVFKKLERPFVTMGEIEKDHWCDDTSLWKRVKEQGFKIHIDTTIHVGHMASFTIWPVQVDGKWYTSFESNGTKAVTTPQVGNDLVTTHQERDKVLITEPEKANA